MRRGTFGGLMVAVAPVVAVVGAGAANGAVTQAVIDFEDGLQPGDIVSMLDAETGISGADAGTVDVFGQRSTLPGENQAMIFDAACGGDPALCSGDDDDLYQPQLGNVLIISADGDSSDPDDADVGERIDFDFSSWGTGVVTVVSLDVLDVEVDESPGVVEMGGGSVPIPNVGDGNVETLPIGLTGSELSVVLNGSGAIDNIVIEFETVTTTTSTSTTTTTSSSTTTTSSSTTTTSTTVPPDDSTTTSSFVVLPPGATTTTTTSTMTPVTELPPTGRSSSGAILAAALLGVGLALVALSRRPVS